jgi:hypothetical protein
VDNRPGGADGTIGAKFFAGSEPDGYTLLLEDRLRGLSCSRGAEMDRRPSQRPASGASRRTSSRKHPAELPR